MRYLWKLILVALSILIVFIATGCAHKAVTENVVGAPSITALPEEGKLHEVVVKQVVADYVSGRVAIPVIVLANKENDRQILPISVGISEGRSINMALKRLISERPGTHDLFAGVLGQFQMKLVKVVITDLQGNTYIAAITMEAHGETKEIDARPSDAMALALRCVAPIFVSEEVIRKGGWIEVPQQDENQDEKQDQKQDEKQDEKQDKKQNERREERNVL